MREPFQWFMLQQIEPLRRFPVLDCAKRHNYIRTKETIRKVCITRQGMVPDGSDKL